MRWFLNFVAGLVLIATSHIALAQGEIRLLVQSSPLAGFRYYAAEARWQEMKEAQALTLIREPENVHDKNAIRVEWRGEKLGYLPRRENKTVAAAMDAGDKIDAKIAKLREHPDPWQRVLIDVFVAL
ncbi:MAG: HIRAN domain-containing protein [Rhodocyclaceae bacterium]|nr:HIRAN domain-containing protein [Rhodocyclaceae bacterium]